MLGYKLKRTKIGGKWNDEWVLTNDRRFRDTPIAKITRRDVIDLLEKIVDRGSRYQARKVFAILSKLFNWALLRDAYGFETSPVARIRHTDILGKFMPRSRVLSDNELSAVWIAAEQTGYPFGTLVQMLMLTGQRLREVSNAKWTEISEQGDVLLIPASRMKAKIAHSVPLPSRAKELLDAVPQFNDGDRAKGDTFIFSTTAGKRPLSGFAKMKERLDNSVKRTAEGAGKESLRNMPRWTLHDIRRTVRTRMSSLGVLPLVAELVIGHKQTGIQAVYDLHTYDREKRAALRLWQEQLMTIVKRPVSPPDNIIMLYPTPSTNSRADVANT